jgi:hypothetical protein
MDPSGGPDILLLFLKSVPVAGFALFIWWDYWRMTREESAEADGGE